MDLSKECRGLLRLDHLTTSPIPQSSPSQSLSGSFVMNHPLWPDHHGKRVWGGAAGVSADAEYAKLFEEAAGAPSLKVGESVGRRGAFV